MRKNILVLALFLCGGFYLAAQSRPNAFIYVSPVTGKGSKPQDNSFFYNQLVYELTDQKISMVKTHRDADYSLIGTVAPYLGGAGQFVFHLILQDNATNEITVEGELLYEVPDDTNELFSVLVTSLLYTIPGEPVRAYGWRDNWLYLGLAATWSPRVYLGTSTNLTTTPYIPLYPLPGLSAEFHFLNFMSFEAGVEMAGDTVKRKDNKSYNNLLLEVPLSVKFVFKPGSNLMLEPYLGANLTFPFFKGDWRTSYPLPLSGLLGFQTGVKAGPGAVFFDIRFAMDISSTSSVGLPISNKDYFQRVIIHLGVGYKYGLFQRK